MQQDQPLNDQNNSSLANDEIGTNHQASTTKTSEVVSATDSDYQKFKEQSKTKKSRSKLKKISLFIFYFAIAIIAINILGSLSNNYDYVNMLNNIATALGFGVAIGIGLLFGYSVSGSTFLETKLPHLKYVFVLFAFLFGLIPGLILMIILTWPISNRACELSGSKNC